MCTLANKIPLFIYKKNLPALKGSKIKIMRIGGELFNSQKNSDTSLILLSLQKAHNQPLKIVVSARLESFTDDAIASLCVTEFRPFPSIRLNFRE